MKTQNKNQNRRIKAVIYSILIILAMGIVVKVWNFSIKMHSNKEEAAIIQPGQMHLRPYHDVFFILREDILKNSPETAQRLENNELILNTITSLCFLIMSILLIYQLKNLIGALKGGNIFQRKNIRLIRRISLLLIYWIAIDFILYQSVQLFIPWEYIEQSINYSPVNKHLFLGLLFSIDYSLLLSAFAFYIIYKIFEEGIRLRQESDLTI